MPLEVARPSGFNENVLALAFPAHHSYRVALYEEHVDLDKYSSSGECASEGYDVGGKELAGYEIVRDGDGARVKFDSLVEWLNVTLTTRCAVVYDADTGVVMSITKFDKPVGVVNGLFSLTLTSLGVVGLGVDDVA